MKEDHNCVLDMMAAFFSLALDYIAVFAIRNKCANIFFSVNSNSALLSFFTSACSWWLPWVKAGPGLHKAPLCWCTWSCWYIRLTISSTTRLRYWYDIKDEGSAGRHYRDVSTFTARTTKTLSQTIRYELDNMAGNMYARMSNTIACIRIWKFSL